MSSADVLFLGFGGRLSLKLELTRWARLPDQRALGIDQLAPPLPALGKQSHATTPGTSVCIVENQTQVLSLSHFPQMVYFINCRVYL